STASPSSGSTPKNEPSYGDGRVIQVSPSSSERNTCPASAAMYSLPVAERAILLRWRSAERSSPPSPNSSSSAEDTGGGGAFSGRGANSCRAQVAPPSVVRSTVP